MKILIELLLHITTIVLSHDMFVTDQQTLNQKLVKINANECLSLVREKNLMVSIPAKTYAFLLKITKRSMTIEMVLMNKCLE